MTDLGRFPFGAPVAECGVATPDSTDAFVLGAYPSALHVRWTPPAGVGKPITAIAVDNEPSVFWDGSSEDDYVRAWSEKFFDPAWGSAVPAPPPLNGSSGRWLTANVLNPLRTCGLENQFVTDCLSTYRLSVGAAERLRDTYDPFADRDGRLERAELGTHPSENQIVTEALQTQTDRILGQLAAARPTNLVTLGNAAARVVAALSDARDFAKLAVGSYGAALAVQIAGHSTTWTPLAHPAAPKVYQEAHRGWLEAGGFCTSA